MKIANYPSLGISDNGMVVLFCKENEGTVVRPGTSGMIFAVGIFIDEWDMSEFEYFGATIELVV